MQIVTRFWLMIGLIIFQAAFASGAYPSFLSTLHKITTLTSTVPANGDVNPYGVAVVPTTAGTLVANNVLISNFNNSANLQGTGTTIVVYPYLRASTPVRCLAPAQVAWDSPLLW